MKTGLTQDLEKDLSILGKNAVLSISQRRNIRDRLFKKIGQLNLVDAIQTHTETEDLVMSVSRLRHIFQPRKILISLPTTVGLVASVFIVTLATGAMAKDATPGETLYPVRKAIDNLRVIIAPASDRANVLLSIATERVEDLKNAQKLGTALEESKKAIAVAQSAVVALNTEDKATEQALAKLKSLIDTQKEVLGTIIKDNIDNEEIKKSVIAVRDEIDKLIPADPSDPAKAGEKTAVAVSELPTKPDLTKPGFVNLTGVMGSYTARPVLIMDGKRYFLEGATVSLIQFMGLGNASAFGYFNPDTLTIQLTKLLIDGRVVWEVGMTFNDLNQSGASHS